jgi:hypothetical protein
MHKFRAGQDVELTPPRMIQAPRGPYSIVRTLPEEREGPHYRIRSKRENHERIAHERELRPLDGADPLFG